MLKKLIKLFEKEKKSLGKSDAYMKKIYKNRVEVNLKGDREVIIFVVDKLGEVFFAGNLTEDYIDKLLYGFELLTGKKAFRDAVNNNIEFRKANIK